MSGHNQDALDAIIDIDQAVIQYGARLDIIEREEILPRDAYDGAKFTETLFPAMGIVRNSVSKQIETLMRLESINSYELSLVLNSSYFITKANTIKLRGSIYRVILINIKEIQDTIISYEVLLAK